MWVSVLSGARGEMPEVYVGLGSNIDAEHHVREGVARLESIFGDLKVSPVYRNAPVGFGGDDFLNLVVSFITSTKAQDITHQLRSIEEQCGRQRNQAKFGPRTLDLDLLLYGELVMDEPGVQVPRTEILEEAYVLKPLADIAPDTVHPVTGKTLESHWKDFESAHHELIPVDVFAGADSSSPP